MQAEVENGLRIFGIERWHTEIGQQLLGGTWRGRRLGRRIVTDDGDRSPFAMRTTQVVVTHGVGGAVKAR